MSRSSWRHAPLPPGWPKTRKRILARDNYVCQLRLEGCKSRASEVHHRGDPDDHGDDNLTSACGPCHATETGRANARRLFRLRAPRRRAPEPHPGMVVPRG